MGRPPSDRVLHRWLATGRPRRVSRRLDDPAVAARLEALSALADRDAAALVELMQPAPDFEERVLAGVRERRDAYPTTSAVADFIGLGFHVARALAPPSEDPTDEASE